MTNKIVLTYLFYLPLALGLTLYVARTLFRNARVFMLDIFKGKEDIALATNRLFEVGFYLLNVGYALLILKVDADHSDVFNSDQHVVETLASKLGGFALYLGGMLFLNLYLFFRGRRKSRQNMTPPTVPVVAAPAR
ncbi:MAG: hypothetical protein JNM62_08760 [Flavobacteriales bacterium]|nr:hypothetical protein [Flavobacteriales bacterium]